MERTIKCTGAASQTKAKRMAALAAGRGTHSPLLTVLVVHVRQRAHLPGAGNAHAPPRFRQHPVKDLPVAVGTKHWYGGAEAFTPHSVDNSYGDPLDVAHSDSGGNGDSVLPSPVFNTGCWVAGGDGEPLKADA